MYVGDNSIPRGPKDRTVNLVAKHLMQHRHEWVLCEFLS